MEPFNAYECRDTPLRRRSRLLEGNDSHGMTAVAVAPAFTRLSGASPGTARAPLGEDLPEGEERLFRDADALQLAEGCLSSSWIDFDKVCSRRRRSMRMPGRKKGW